MNDNMKGMLIAASTYIIWGIFPFYWKLLSHVNPVEIILHRILWSFVFTGILVLRSTGAKKIFAKLKDMRAKRKPLISVIFAGYLVVINWSIFIFAVVTNRIVDCALGYYINPLVTITLAYIFLKEHLRKNQIAAICVSALGVLAILIYNRALPWISILLPLSFGIYGLLKKNVKLKTIESVFIETAIVMPVVIALLIYMHSKSMTQFAFNYTGLLLILGGPITAIPLIMFSKALKLTKLSTVGTFQYITPSMAFLIGIFVYKEPFNIAYGIAFVLIWIGVGLYLKPSRSYAMNNGRKNCS